ncbi:DNA-J protein, putative [Bodo saltans]|uniref:DNA-J protein, putative n=1 Tax=Bodo saltans TaxID=75058 RepID=A0A0S4KIH6_BODSA|nr:DNA-J protein, putative [Bodo saltans]|eukprot:CUI15501.1 DNA-J protein, putative [Bodo saltans]
MLRNKCSALFLSVALCNQRRFGSGVFHSREFYAATKEVPQTPGGRNPYELLEMPITKTTTLDEISKQRRELVQKYHPDAQGGSTEKMAEINAAHQIIKEHHSGVLRRFKDVEQSAKANDAYRQHRDSRQHRDDNLGRSGGVNRRNVRAMNEQQTKATSPPRTQKEIETQWETFRTETENSVASMCRRYEFAVDQGRFFRKSAMLNEITVRERWLRKSFIKGIWEDVHEMRGELLRRGARNAQQSQLAEEMVAFAGVMLRKLNDDFARLTQLCVHNQSRMYAERAVFILIFFYLVVRFLKWATVGFFNGSLTVRFRAAMLGY